MIRIAKFGEVAPEEIFARAVPETDVSGAVSEILSAVRRDGRGSLGALRGEYGYMGLLGI